MVAPIEVHHKAGRVLLALLMNPFKNKSSKSLSEEKCTHQEKIGIPGKAYTRQKPEGDNEGYRYMYGKEPLYREPFHVCPPISERDVQNKHNNGYNNQNCHSLDFFFLFFLLAWNASS